MANDPLNTVETLFIEIRYTISDTINTTKKRNKKIHIQNGYVDNFIYCENGKTRQTKYQLDTIGM